MEHRYDVIVIGCGALGSLVAASAASMGRRVLLLCKRRARAQQLARDGIVVRGMGREIYARASAEPLRLGVKYSSRVAVAATRIDELDILDSLSLEVDAIVYVQPSIEIAKRLDDEKTGLLAVYGCAWINREDGSVGYAAGKIRYSGAGAPEVAAGLANLGFEDAGSPGKTSLLWDYAAAHAAVQAVSAALGVPASGLRKSSHALSLVDSAAREALLVMEKAGVKSFRSPVDAARELVSVRGCYPAMLRDLDSRRPTEVDYMNAAIVKAALRYGVYAAYNDSLYLLVKALEEVNEIRGEPGGPGRVAPA